MFLADCRALHILMKVAVKYFHKVTLRTIRFLWAMALLGWWYSVASTQTYNAILAALWNLSHPSGLHKTLCVTFTSLRQELEALWVGKAISNFMPLNLLRDKKNLLAYYYLRTLQTDYKIIFLIPVMQMSLLNVM